MQVIPSINESDFQAVVEKIHRAETFLPQGAWVHIDVTDGIFTPHIAWNNPLDLMQIKTALALEVHLMVVEPERQLQGWLQALTYATKSRARLIVQAETMTDPATVIATCAGFGVEVGISFKPRTSLDFVLAYFGSFRVAQLLAVDPGRSGQPFQSNVWERIAFLRQKLPNVIIEVDGGMNPATALQAKEAGADIIIAGSYIWGSPSPEEAHEELARI